MKRLLASLILLLAFAAVPFAAGPSYLKSVMPLSGEDGQGGFINFCSTSSINQDKGYWLTAAHCIGDGNPAYIFGQRTAVVAFDMDQDIAILSTPFLRAPDIPLGSEPTFNTAIKIVGHPLGYESVWVTRGYVANPSGIVGGVGPFMLFSAPAAPGSSGSVILNSKDRVISLLQIGWGYPGSFGPVSGGITFKNLEKFKKYFRR